MRIRLQRHPERHGDEWVIVEMQGAVSVGKGQTFGGKELGDLKLENGEPRLKIGHYLLSGSIVKLKKPMLVLGGREKPVDGKAKIDIIGRIKEKYVFRKRPTFVLSSRS
mmetsp:Transcript_14334/g.34944  ORF Transcript_14334/g.34944 Transcript_14334/m.34944 type:complete len:109 (-) Transcript_14334:212-538(-)